jgi:hypothetical protein
MKDAPTLVDARRAETSHLGFDPSRGNSRLAPARGRGADDAPECAVEGGLGLVTDTSGNFSEPERTFTQQSSCNVKHPISPRAELLDYSAG